MGKSHQKGWIILRGKKWYGYFRREVIDPETNQPKATIVPVVLGAKSSFPSSKPKEHWNARSRESRDLFAMTDPRPMFLRRSDGSFATASFR